MRAFLFPRNSVFLFFFPFFYVLVVAFFREGESALRFMDPDYIYLTNGFSVATGGLPYYYDSPGTFVQILAGVMLWIADVDAQDIIARSTHYHALLNLAFSCLNALGIFCLGVFFYKRKMPYFLILAAQLSLCLTMFHGTSGLRVNPETLAPFLMSMACILYLAEFRGKYTAYAVWTGLALATKIYYWPLVLGFFFWRPFLRVLSGFFVSGCVFLGALFLYRNNFHMAVSYYWRILTRSHYAGTGAEGLPDFSVITGAVQMLFSRFYSTIMIPAVLALLLLALCRRKIPLPSHALGALAITVGFIVSFLKYPFHDYYIIPAILMVPWALIAAWTEGEQSRVLRWTTYGACSIVLATAAFDLGRNLKIPLVARQQYEDASHAIRALVEDNKHCSILTYGSVNYAPMAFWFASISNDGRLNPALAQAFPEHYFTRDFLRFFSFDGKKVNVEEFFKPPRDKKCILFLTSNSLENVRGNLRELLRGARLIYSMSDLNFVYRKDTLSAP